MNPFSKPFTGREAGERKPVNPPAKQQVLNYHLRVSEKHVDMLCGMPEFRELTTDELLKLIPSQALRKAIPPLGEDQTIREAAYEREIRMRRAVIIGILATPERIAEYESQRFVERL